ncbi:ankyrin repeat-containing protein BDA1-like [Vicia villosa]|uniref:ankyrin repeat-containing protein BDA1-like n=1 Tax=Vicia villosa TaxID=3911 RepID=UPI00273A7EC7|nr:ankyrin repeat-containing protein BDA1-like [Vicia villosa]
MNTKIGDQLKLSVETDNIELLYEVIQDDPSILETIDKHQFVDTPLHIAAAWGHLEFATEIMNLKPSFATKLNLQGYSPIHLAMNRLHYLVMDSLTNPATDSPTRLAMESSVVFQRAMVSKLVDINKDLVRVKGRKGLTPLHFACQIGDVELLAEFLTACPDSIEDENVSGESALHIAVINHQFRALQVLVGWLKENYYSGARRLEEKLLNHKDKAGNTVLHISALSDDPKFLQFLVKTGQIKLNAKNLQQETALDLAKNQKFQIILKRAKAKHGSEVSRAPTHAEEITSKNTIIDNMIPWIRRTINDITEEQRNTWLVVATLVATATFESALNPPGGVFQVSASGDNNVKTTTYGFFSVQGNAGKSILSRDSFMVFSLANMLSFCVSIIAILILTPGGAVGRLVILPVGLFVCCYLIAMPAISPTHANTTILYIPMYSIVFLLALYFTFIMCKDTIWRRSKRGTWDKEREKRKPQGIKA